MGCTCCEHNVKKEKSIKLNKMKEWKTNEKGIEGFKLWEREMNMCMISWGYKNTNFYPCLLMSLCVHNL